MTSNGGCDLRDASAYLVNSAMDGEDYLLN